MPAHTTRRNNDRNFKLAMHFSIYNYFLSRNITFIIDYFKKINSVHIFRKVDIFPL